jgi:hypothetical protein
MAKISCQLEGENFVDVECEITGAFTKNQSGERTNPISALQRTSGIVGQTAAFLASGLVSELGSSDVDFELQFSVRLDSAGAVMISQSPSEGQFLVTVRKHSG